jgi:hypothetical protein
MKRLVRNLPLPKCFPVSALSIFAPRCFLRAPPQPEQLELRVTNGDCARAGKEEAAEVASAGSHADDSGRMEAETQADGQTPLSFARKTGHLMSEGWQT